jgi:translation initiation factor 1
MKREFACNGTVVSSADSSDEDSPGPTKPDFGKVIQLQGDQRVAVKNFLVSFGLVTEKEAKDHIVMCV